MVRLSNYFVTLDRSHNIADVVVEPDRVDQSMFGALKSPSRMSLLLSEERASTDCTHLGEVLKRTIKRNVNTEDNEIR